MKCEMEIEEIEGVIEKLWDIHDRLSDAIHSISRSRFINSMKPLKPHLYCKENGVAQQNNKPGFVYVKDFTVNDGESTIQEAKSLNSIRTALENLEDQLEFFHTVLTQQRAERDAAIAGLEQSRIILALRLSEHKGRKYKVLEEALAFIGDVHDATRSVSPENLYNSPQSHTNKMHKRSNVVIRVILSSFDFVKKIIKVDQMGGIVGNATLFAISVMAFLRMHQIAYKDQPFKQQVLTYSNRGDTRKISNMDCSSSYNNFEQLDVMLARG